MADLASRFDACVSKVSQAHLVRLASLGVSPSAISSINLRGFAALGILEGAGEKSGLFLQGPGRAHIVQPVADDGVLIDLVAWHSLQPLSWWLVTGHGWALNPGEFSLSRLGWDDLGPVFLRESPLSWMRAGGHGAVVLDWSAVELAQLREHPVVECETAALAATVDRELRRSVRFPKIILKETRLAA